MKNTIQTSSAFILNFFQIMKKKQSNIKRSCKKVIASMISLKRKPLWKTRLTVFSNNCVDRSHGQTTIFPTLNFFFAVCDVGEFLSSLVKKHLCYHSGPSCVKVERRRAKFPMICHRTRTAPLIFTKGLPHQRYA